MSDISIASSNGYFMVESELYNTRGHKLRILTLEKAQFVTVTGIACDTRYCPLFLFLRRFHGLETAIQQQVIHDLQTAGEKKGQADQTRDCKKQPSQRWG